MIKFVRHTAIAAGIAALSLASSASFAASYSYDFKTFFDTSTSFDLLDTKTLGYAVATLTISDVAGGVQMTVNQPVNAFAAKTGGTYIEGLWLAGPKGTLSSVSGSKLTTSAGYQSLILKDAGYLYNWNIDFATKSLAEGGSSTFNIMGAGVTASAFAKMGTSPMIDLGNVGSPYTGFLGLNSSVHFLGKPTVLPEPASYALMGLGLVGLAAVARRRAA
jgi:PEP-CTERM motif